MMTGYSESIAALTKAGKTNYGAPAYSRFVNRPMGRRLAAAAHVAGMTPNAVTAMSAVASLAGILLIAIPSPSVLSGIMASLLLILGYALDSADGQLARLRGGGSPEGEWLDHVVDMAKTVLIHSAVLISLMRFSSESWTEALLPLGFLLVAVVSFFAWLLVDLLKRVAGVPATRPASSGAPLLRTLLRTPSDYGALIVAFVLWGTPIFTWVYAALFLGSAAILLAALPTWFRQARQLGGVGS